jgi:hypothetical protein
MDTSFGHSNIRDELEVRYGRDMYPAARVLLVVSLLAGAIALYTYTVEQNRKVLELEVEVMSQFLAQ